MDVHRQEPIVQDGIKRDGLRLQDQDRRMQERRCHRRGEEELVRWLAICVFTMCGRFGDVCPCRDLERYAGCAEMDFWTPLPPPLPLYARPIGSVSRCGRHR